jgi:hypothetical protein
MRLLLAYIHSRSDVDADSGWTPWTEISALRQAILFQIYRGLP